MENNECAVVIFNGTHIPLRHIVSTQISGPGDIAEFKQWYYENFNAFPSDQFVFCKTAKERNELLEILQTGTLYQLQAPVWAEVEDCDGDITDMSARFLRKYSGDIQSVVKTYADESDFAAFLNMDAAATFKEHVSLTWPCIEMDENDSPYLSIYLMLNCDDISERSWNRLFDVLNKWLQEGWGETLTDDYPCHVHGENIYLHFGDSDHSERIDFDVKKI